MKSKALFTAGLFFLGFIQVISFSYASSPVWTLTPLTETTISVSTADTATIQYQVTNQSRKTHMLEMRGIPGISQNTTSGNCSNPFILGYQQSCTLTLVVDGAKLQGNVLGGPLVCQQGNTLQCYKPSQENSLSITKTNNTIETTLSVSTTNLALSVTGLTEYGVSGTPSSGLARIITITNTGSNSAVNLLVTSPTWPAGTSSSTNCDSTLAASSSCTITITPGDTATSDGTNPCSNGTAPIPGLVQVSADNANTVSSNVVILGYSCIYQGGYVYAFDDTTPNTGSVGGKVATTSDQAAVFPNGIIWSSNGGTGGGSGGIDSIYTSYDTLPGIDEASTSTTGSPTYSTFSTFFSSNYTNVNPFNTASFSQCNGALDGFCNTENIMTFYNQFITNNTLANGGTAPFTASAGPTNIAYYAPGLCKQTIGTYSDWYLPAICEMGYRRGACGTSVAPTLQNIQSSLIDISGLHAPSAPQGNYWSSTEYSVIPQSEVWYQFFNSGGGGGDQHYAAKYYQIGVRCSRALTL